MHCFISIMLSLLVIIGLQVSVESAGRRSERSFDRHYISELMVPNGGRWGSWGHREMCPDGMYAAGFSLQVEVSIDRGDDTGLNGIRLHCIDGLFYSYHNYASVQSVVGSWGRWTEIKWCPFGFLIAFQLRVEKSLGNGDDTAANNIKFQCSGGSLLLGDGTQWGDWSIWSPLCPGTGICGIKTRVEAPLGQGDDTALNDVIMFCCN